jgi:hypothetical protein
MAKKEIHEIVLALTIIHASGVCITVGCVQNSAFAQLNGLFYCEVKTIMAVQ